MTSKTPSLLFQASAKDNLEIKNVDFILDGKTIASLIRPPYVLPWQTPGAGRHALTVKAADLAGNTSTAEVNFEVK
jgi:hypothetical protein